MWILIEIWGIIKKYNGVNEMKKVIYLNDSIHGLISLSEYEKRIISSVGFNRLHDVYQNSTVYLTFPTNRTKRFEHSIGTMKLCSDMFYSSVLNAIPKNLEAFYNIFYDEYKKMIDEIAKQHEFCEQKLGGITPDAIPNIELDKFRHSLIPHNVKHKFEIIHLLLIQSIRVAALLHDIGHPPFSHIVEYALKAVYKEGSNANNNSKSRWADFLDTMSKYFEDNKKLHEQMGDEISDSILRGIISNINDEDETYNENLYEILVYESVKKIFGEIFPFNSLHRIIDSSLDGDRLDYVTRDSLNSGIDSGKIDYNRIINDMQLIVDDKEIFFCVPLKAVNSVEDFIKRRYNIYKNIIYHHRVIKTDYLLEYSVKDLVKKYLNTKSEKNNVNSKILIPFDISGLWFPLGESTTAEKFNALSQWNDSWLMTVLKQIYYTEYYRKKDIKSNTNEYILKQRLSELLRNTKCYYSLIKRGENFKIIDDEVKMVLSESKDEIGQLVTNINELSNKLGNTESTEGVTVDIKGTLDFIDEILNNISKAPKGFVLSFIARRYKAIKIESFENFVKEVVESETQVIFTNIKCYDTITVFKNISIGLDSPIYFYNYDGHVCTLDEISGISDILRLDSDYLPVFYIYIMIENGEDIVKEKRNAFLQKIGSELGSKIKNQIVSELKKQIEQMEE
jgi:HD superfamily phosphohydrolase